MILVWFWFGSSLDGHAAKIEENFRTTTLGRRFQAEQTMVGAHLQASRHCVAGPPRGSINAIKWAHSVAAVLVRGLRCRNQQGSPMIPMPHPERRETAGPPMLRRWLRPLQAAAIALLLLVTPSAVNAGPNPGAPGSDAHVYLLRGVLNIFSLGLDDIAERLRQQGIPATVSNYLFWSSVADEAAADY